MKALRLLAVAFAFIAYDARCSVAYEAVNDSGVGSPLSQIMGDPNKEGTHARLARKSIALFESYYGQSIPANLREQLVLGSMEEDFDIDATADPNVPSGDPGVWQDDGSDPVVLRWCGFPLALQCNRAENHFSPTLNHGVGVHVGYNNDAVVWALSSNDNRCDWNDALADGDTLSGWRKLGHVLHILQDLSVPDHVRNDYHAGDAPYEAHVAGLSTVQFDALTAPATQPTAYSRPSDVLNGLATFTRANFFSKDTILYSTKYGVALPTPPLVTTVDYLEHATMGHRLCKKGSIIVDIALKYQNPSVAQKFCTMDNIVYDDTANSLLPQAVSHGANLIFLFFGQVHGLEPSADARILQSNPSTNFGTQAGLQVGIQAGTSWLVESYAHWDVSRAPAGAVQSAVIEFTVTGVTNPGVARSITCRYTASSWSETTITWNSKPAWGSLIASSPVSSTGTIVSAPVTGSVASWIQNPATNYGVVLNASQEETTLGSRESSLSFRPRLKIVYSP